MFLTNRYASEIAEVLQVALLGLGVTLMLLAAAVPAYEMSKDWRRLRKLQVRDRMTRFEIATALSSLTTDKFRVRFVRLLNDRRVVATGEWPDGFSFRHDPALTYLAKLEERWLGLDR